RFNRRVVIGVAAVACVAVGGATLMALYAPSLPRGSGGELLDTGRKQVADGLAGLPSSYGDLARPTPKLGAPLPGDLGPPVVAVERNLGVAPQENGLRPNPEEDAARAERIRLVRQAQDARESKVFFAVSLPAAQAGTAVASAGKEAGAADTGKEPAAPSAPLDLDPTKDPNDQQHKLDLLNAKQDDHEIYNPHGLQHPVSPYQVMAGTLVAASLLTGLNSDLPGLVTAQITENVYDTVTGRTLLIPQGARLIGAYDSVVAFGQSRALVVWQRIILPNGSSIVIDNLPATDASGYAGLQDEVDYHTWALLKGVVLSTLVGVGGQIGSGNQQSNLVEAIRQSTQDSTNQAGQRIVQKDLNIQPTITIRPGWPLRVVIHKDLVLQPYRT
ncbi:MAG: type secretion system protein TrbI, partial [Aliidongia sp.]|nr:type secretion system protein TrbI [Aliidongia sp.]